MDLEVGEKIILNRKAGKLDRFVQGFLEELEKTKYVLISGYVSILFGRSRLSEDIDINHRKTNKRRIQEVLGNNNEQVRMPQHGKPGKSVRGIPAQQARSKVF